MIHELINQRQLRAVFQPVGRLDDGRVHAHEALIRGPQGSALESPAALFALAQSQDMVFELERACLETVLQRWGRQRERGRLFVNLSPGALIRLMDECGPDFISRQLRQWGLLARQLVVEITEQGIQPELQTLANAVKALRKLGMAVALDDFGQGSTNLRMWSELRPEVVKIDQYFVQNVAHDADKADTVRALQRMALIFGAELVAEGIETEADLRLLRDLGLEFGQGYLLGRPLPNSMTCIDVAALQVLQSKQVSVGPPARQSNAMNLSERLNIIQAPGLSPDALCEELAELFQAQPELHAVALLDGKRPVGLINRMHFLNEYSKMYYRELWGHKPCYHWANKQPRLVERNYRIDELLGILTSDDQRYLSDGFIVVDNGLYLGLCRGDQIVKAVTESRIESARHANPLTFLPGNIPITQHIERLLARGSSFVVSYLDLNYFKSFNDRYGYWRGDEMIRLVASVARDHVQAQQDFLGHVGGDDFVVIYQDLQWEDQCLRMIEEFNARAVALFDPADRERGGIEAEDRQGVVRFFPFTSLSIGAVQVNVGEYRNAQDVANAAASAKHAAKMSAGGLARYRHAVQPVRLPETSAS
ncbi:MAG: diguanylate phosphodiesterase [Comamonadaceae bacterium CG_4_9_14_3_um_filter_60_33]|nr:MAG: diguanylate phosphodiesterase [Comamonadaceae bacterium CG_4_9_14_3_um_filter_60_33]